MYLHIDMKLSVLSIQKNPNLLWLGDSYFPSAFNSFLESLLLFKSPHCMGFIWIFTDYTTQCNVIFYYEYDEAVCGEGCRGWLPELHLHTWPRPRPPPAPTSQTPLHCCFSTHRPSPSHRRRAHILSIHPANIAHHYPLSLLSNESTEIDRAVGQI